MNRVALVAGCLGTALIGWSTLGSDPALPWLTLEVAGTNVHLALGKAQTNQAYTIQFSPVVPAGPWYPVAVGGLGQSNFTVGRVGGSGFYRAALGDDWDGDGVRNGRDANPSDAGVGLLRVTIEEPAGGSTVD